MVVYKLAAINDLSLYLYWDLVHVDKIFLTIKLRNCII